ncbi:unnamed protein product [Linum trigynum]|uniref:Uncharacterized protein n=1 Tax=Linum trigynum TaxID=586398 RepID=A0AAV2FRP6_9ROSI
MGDVAIDSGVGERGAIVEPVDEDIGGSGPAGERVVDVENFRNGELQVLDDGVGRVGIRIGVKNGLEEND